MRFFILIYDLSYARREMSTEISVACHHVIFFAIARSQASSGYRFILRASRSKLYPNSALSGQTTC
jgi:hypothetical protein